jgi:hypothetical protein
VGEKVKTTKGDNKEDAADSAEVDKKNETKGDKNEEVAVWAEVDEKEETTKGDNKEDAQQHWQKWVKKMRPKVTTRKRRHQHWHQQKWRRRTRSKMTTISQSAEASACVEDVENAPATSNVTKSL